MNEFAYILASPDFQLAADIMRTNHEIVSIAGAIVEAHCGSLSGMSGVAAALFSPSHCQSTYIPQTEVKSPLDTEQCEL